jgi:hypothetical protein
VAVDEGSGLVHQFHQELDEPVDDLDRQEHS